MKPGRDWVPWGMWILWLRTSWGRGCAVRMKTLRTSGVEAGCRWVECQHRRMVMVALLMV